MKRRLVHYVRQIKNGRIKEMFGEIRWVYRYTKSHVLSILLYTLLGLSGIVVSLISSLVSRDLVDIITGHKTSELLTTFLVMLGTTLGSTLIGQISSYISIKISMKVENQLKAIYYDEIMATEWEALSAFHSGDLQQRWNGDVSVVSNGILNIFPNCVIFTARFISALAMVLYYDASFAAFALASIPISMVISRESLRRMKKSNMSGITINAKISAFNQESFSNVQTVKAFDMISLYSKKLRELQKEYVDIRLKYQKTAIVNAIILTCLSLVVSYAAQGWGIYKVWSGSITYGTMVMFLSLSSTLSGAVNNLISLVPNTIGLTNASKRLRDILDLPKEDYSQNSEVAKFYAKNVTRGVGICIRNVAYTYPRGTEEVFCQVTFDAHPHEIVALVGPSGEGKTTMLRFFLALIHEQEGRGFVCAGDNTPETGEPTLSLSASARRLFAYVPQGNTMFAATIAENMRNVKENASDDEIIGALRMACAWEFVSKLPNGINTMIQERGGGFSEGQVQRLSIARALLRRSPILLLDEATSALDVYTEKKVLQNIMADEYPRTTIVTTHRPSVLSACDRVYAIRNKTCEILSKDEIRDMSDAYK